MTGGEPRKPLWADSLAQRPRQSDVNVSWTLDEPEDADQQPAPEQPQHEPQAERQPVTWMPVERQPVAQWAFGIAIALLVLCFMVAAVTKLPRLDSLTVEEVPSYWGTITMTCHTVLLEDDGRAFERFRCRAIDGGVLPPGLYRSPEDQWTSDITRRQARTNEIRISENGELVGWAEYY